MKFQMQGPLGARTVINGSERDYFAGCGYLGLQSHPAILRAVEQAAKRYGIGAATSRSEYGYGDSPIYVELEREAAAYFGEEHILYYASGYLGMTILVQGLSDRYEHIFIDEVTHYSGWDGARTAGKPITPFRHCDPGSLAKACRRELEPGERPLVLSDGVFPVSGAIAPVPEYWEVVGPYDGLICLDDAHASGVLGENGRGTLEYFALNDKDCYASHTLSKALGTYGGLIPGNNRLMEELNRHSRVQFGATLPPLPIVAAAVQALALMRAEPQRRQCLWDNVARAQNGVRALGWEVPDTPVPIICLKHRPGLDLEQIQDDLFARDIAIAYVAKYSDAPKGGALRIAIFATHTAEQIDRLLEELGSIKNVLSPAKGAPQGGSHV